MDNEITNQETVKQALSNIRAQLEVADQEYHDATEDLRQAILDVRPTGWVTVPQMAAAIGRHRNYIDTLWSASGMTSKGSQTRTTAASIEVDQAANVLERLTAVADIQRRAHADAKLVRAERDRALVMTYQSKILGPTMIASYLGIDRNHVLRTVRNAGISPVHRTNIKNQYSATA